MTTLILKMDNLVTVFPQLISFILQKKSYGQCKQGYIQTRQESNMITSLVLLVIFCMRNHTVNVNKYQLH